MCSDCMENSSNYSKDPDYQSARVLDPADGGAEFQQRAAPPPSYTSCQQAEPSHDTSLCNGTTNGMREFQQHRLLLQQNQQNQHHGTGEAQLVLIGPVTS